MTESQASIQSQIIVAQELDASGHCCPIPILRANRILRSMAVGQILKVISTDPGSMQDFPAYCFQAGIKLLSSEQVIAKPRDQFVFHIQR